MALEKVVERKIEILSDGTIQVRDEIIITEDGKELARSYHRSTLPPGAAVEQEDSRTQLVAQAVWTPDVVSAYEAKMLSAREQASDMIGEQR